MAGINLDELNDLQIIDSNGDELNVNADGSLNVDLIAGAETIITDGTDTLEIDANGAACVKVQDSAGDILAIEADGSINANFSAAPTTVLKNTNETVGVAAAQVLTTALASRRFVTIQNEGNQDVFFGDSGVTVANGIKVSKRSSGTYELGPAVVIYMISGTAGQDVRFLEIA